MATLSFKHINKVYSNKVQAVFDFNLDIADKEFIVFVGPSGCGKSTTLRMVAGLEEITSGELYIDNRLVNFIDPKDRDIAMVFQNYVLYPHMNVFENLAFNLKLRKIPTDVYTNDESTKELLSKKKKLYSLARKEQWNIRWFDKQLELGQEKKIYSKIIKRENLLAKKEASLKHLEDLYSDMDALKEQLETHIVYHIDKKKVKQLEEAIAYQNETQNKDEKLLDFLKESLEFSKNHEVKKQVLRHMNKVDIYRQVNDVAKILNIDMYLNRKPRALSGGQRQRVALGRAIVRKPKVFLMDEPLSNLDAKLRVQMRGEIIRIHNSVQATTIYVTHDQTEAMTMATRIVVMKDGHIQQIGTPTEVYEHPQNVFVASFIGSPIMNFLSAKVENEFLNISNQSKVVLSSSQKEQLKLYNNREIILGVRPEDIKIATNDENNLFFICSSLELLGSELIVYGKIEDREISIKAPAGSNIKIGDKVYISLNSEHFHFFDKETQMRIETN